MGIWGSVREAKGRTGLGLVLGLSASLGSALWLLGGYAPADPAVPVEPGDVIVTPAVVPELFVEVETELAPGSLKQAPLWKELVQILEDPYSPPERRRSFRFDAQGNELSMPPLEIHPLDRNPLTGQPLRLCTSDGEISRDLPGPLVGEDDGDPTTLLPIVGWLREEPNGVDPDGTDLVVRDVAPGADLPPDGTIVAIPAVRDGRLLEYDPATGETEEVLELEQPPNEEHFFRPETDVAGVPPALRGFIGRPAAEVLGKALFWDMQVGSDGVQACGSCHFHAGTDDRTRNSLNPNTTGGDGTLQVRGPDSELAAEDFPFHRLKNPEFPGEPRLNPTNVARDANDVVSSMGVRFRRFVDIPAPGPSAFGPPFDGVRALLPDIGEAVPDPVPAFRGLRRVEGRNTPTFHSSAFNFDSSWDGRARFHFNGGSPFGPSDPQFHVFVNDGTAAGPLHGLPHPADPELDLVEWGPEPGQEPVPVRIEFCSLASLATGSALSSFEMSFDGRNWAKLAKKLLQAGVVPLANQQVAVDDSILGPFSNLRVTADRTGLGLSYPQLIQLAFARELWACTSQHFEGAPDAADPFDGYSLALAAGPASPTDTGEFTQMEANFSLFFGLAFQSYAQLTIPDDTPFDRFMDANPLAGNGLGQPGKQGTLPPAAVPELVGDLTLVPGFGPDELFGFDIFAGANLTAALPRGSRRNPDGQGSNPFLRTARCMLCHMGPEQTDHTFNVNHGLLSSDTEFELPPPGEPEPTGPFKTVSALMLEDEVMEPARGGVEVQNRDFAIVDDPLTPWDDRQVAVPGGIAFQDNGIHNIGLRPSDEDILRGGYDPFGWPLSLAALALKNLAGPGFEPADRAPAGGGSILFDSGAGIGNDGLFEEVGDGFYFPGTTHTIQSINPGFETEPAEPRMPPTMAPFLADLPAGGRHPLIDELACAPNTVTAPFAEVQKIQFGSDLHCSTYDPDRFPENGWGPRCPNTQSAVPNNFGGGLKGTWPFANRVARRGAAKAPQLRNVELTGPYFHTGSYLTLRQVVDFYMRGGDFPITNAEDRDPNLVDVREQAFGFGSTIGLPPEFQDGGPDTISLYDSLPAEAQEDAVVSLVKFLLSLTDARVKFERAPFDRPEIFVPVDGTAPDNTSGRPQFSGDARFRRLPAVGAGGHAEPLPNFLGVSSVEGTSGPDHFDPVTGPPMTLPELAPTMTTR